VVETEIGVGFGVGWIGTGEEVGLTLVGWIEAYFKDRLLFCHCYDGLR
jgi:hypothetical protein